MFIILSERLQFHEIRKEIGQIYQVRINRGPEVADIIFPKLGLAFILINLKEFLEDKDVQKTNIKHLAELKATFQKAFCISLVNPNTINSFTSVQVIPVPSYKQAVAIMTKLSTPDDHKDMFQNICDNLDKKITDTTWSGSKVLTRIPGISEETGDLLLHGMGSIKRIALATENELRAKTPLDLNTITTITQFFSQK